MVSMLLKQRFMYKECIFLGRKNETLTIYGLSLEVNIIPIYIDL